MMADKMDTTMVEKMVAYLVASMVWKSVEMMVEMMDALWVVLRADQSVVSMVGMRVVSLVVKKGHVLAQGLVGHLVETMVAEMVVQ